MLFLRSGSCVLLLRSNWTYQILQHARLITTTTNTVANKSDQQNIVHSPYDSINLQKGVLLHHLIWKDVEKWPNKIAIECGIHGKKYSYAELRRQCKKFATALLKIGLKSGQDTLTLVLPNMPEFPVVTLGAIEAGLIVSPMNPIYSADEIAHQMADCRSTCVVTHYDQLNTVLRALAQGQFKNQIRVICVDDYDGRTKSLPSGVIRFSEMINNSEELSDNIEGIKAENIVLLPYSSGTTGLPKGVCLSHDNITSNVGQLTHSQMDGIIEASENHQDTVPGILPFYHIYGYVVGMLRGLYKGAKIVTVPKFEPKSFLNVLKCNKEIFLHAVPPIILFLGAHPSVQPDHLDQLRTTMSGAAPCSAEDIGRLMAKKKHRIFQAYGLTESSPALTYPLLTDDTKSHSGSLLFDTLGKVIDWKTGETLPLGNVGELCFKGPQVMLGYLNKPEASAETVDKDGWLHTGDIGYFDTAGRCYILDRIKELIKVKGFQVPPAELEAVLRQHPAILDAGVTSVACSKNGEAPVAFVVLKPDRQQTTEGQIRSYVASKVAPYKQLSQVVLVDSIPKSNSGKILRRKLKELVKSELKPVALEI